MHLLCKNEDVRWLKQTHLKSENVSGLPDFTSAIIHGTKDCPVKIELFRERYPYVDAKPIVILKLDAERKYSRVE